VNVERELGRKVQELLGGYRVGRALERCSKIPSNSRMDKCTDCPAVANKTMEKKEKNKSSYIAK
jgi:hypothetical protein